jgi:hypothetical protein
MNADFRKGKTLVEIYGKEKSEIVRNKYKNRKRSKETNQKRSESCRKALCGYGNKGRKCSEANKLKFRLMMVERLRKTHQNFHPPYNEKACHFFDKLMFERNINIQHALNGGEYHIKELEYWVDGYDVVNNTVYEYDEKFHFDSDGKLSEKDIIRENLIKNHLNCKFILIKNDG